MTKPFRALIGRRKMQGGQQPRGDRTRPHHALALEMSRTGRDGSLSGLMPDHFEGSFGRRVRCPRPSPSGGADRGSDEAVGGVGAGRRIARTIGSSRNGAGLPGALLERDRHEGAREFSDPAQGRRSVASRADCREEPNLSGRSTADQPGCPWACRCRARTPKTAPPPMPISAHGGRPGSGEFRQDGRGFVDLVRRPARHEQGLGSIRPAGGPRDHHRTE
jgi:hypothetical protein